MTNQSARSDLLLHLMDLNAQLHLIGEALGEMGQERNLAERTRRTLNKLPAARALLEDLAVMVSDEGMLAESTLDAIRELLDVRLLAATTPAADGIQLILELL